MTAFLNLLNGYTLPRGLTLRNRVAMAPMTTYSANDDFTMSGAELDFYEARAAGVGLVITGCTHVSANGIGFRDEYAAFDDRFLPSLARLARASKSGGAASVLQIFHAGNKAQVDYIPSGDMVSASAVATDFTPFVKNAVVPRALTEAQIEGVIRDFGQAARRAIEAGFDGVEIHGAHGFLLQNFLSPHFNRRTDRWGGPIENRLRFPLAVVREVQGVALANGCPDFLVGYRISPDEPQADGLRLADTLDLIERLIEVGIDYVHLSLGSVLSQRPVDAGDAGPLLISTVVEAVAGRTGVIAAGQLRTPAQAEAALALGLDLAAVGQGLVMNPDWVSLAATGHDDQVATVLRASAVSGLHVPGGLWTTIQETQGWFQTGP